MPTSFGTFTGSLADDRVTSIAVAADGTVYAGTRAGGLFSRSPSSGAWTPRTGPTDVASVAIGADGRVWAGGTWLGAYTPAGDSWTYYEPPSPYPATAIAPAPDGSLWLASTARVWHGEPTSGPWTAYDTCAVAISEQQCGFREWWCTWADGRCTPDFAAYCGRSQGGPTCDTLLCYEDAGGCHPRYFDGEVATSVALTTDGSVWLGWKWPFHPALTTSSPGLDLWRGFELGPQSVTALSPGPDGSIWVGTSNEGLKRYDPAEDSWASYSSLSHGLASDFVTSISLEDHGGVWIGTDLGPSHLYPLIDPQQTTAHAVGPAVQVDWRLSPAAEATLSFRGQGGVSCPGCGYQVYRSLSRDSGFEALLDSPLVCGDDAAGEPPCTVFDTLEVPAGVTRYYRIALRARRWRVVEAAGFWNLPAELRDQDLVLPVRTLAAPRFTLDATEPAQSVRAGEVATYALELRGVDGFAGLVTLALAGGGPAGLTATLPAPAAPSVQQVTLQAPDYATLDCPLEAGVGKRCRVTIVSTGADPLTGATLQANEVVLLNVLDPARSGRFLTQYPYGPQTRTVDAGGGARAVEQVVEVAQRVEVRGRLYPAMAPATVTTTFTPPAERGGPPISVSSATDAAGFYSHGFEPPLAGRWSMRSVYDPDPDVSDDEVSTDGQPHLSPPDIMVDRARTASTLFADNTPDTQPDDTLVIAGRLVPHPQSPVALDVAVQQADGAYAFKGPLWTDAQGGYRLEVEVRRAGYMRAAVAFPGTLDYRDSSADLVIPIQQGIGMAVVVAGAGTTHPLFPMVETLGDAVVNTLRRRNMPDNPLLPARNRIRYLHPSSSHDVDGDGVGDTDGAASLADLTAAIATWAPSLVQTTLAASCLGYPPPCEQRGGACDAVGTCWWAAGVQQTPLTVYLIGDADEDGFFVNEIEQIDGATIDSTLDAFAQAVKDRFLAAGVAPPASVPLNLIVESPMSGDFVAPASQTGRVVLTSTDRFDPGRGAGGLSYVASGGSVSFSSYFLSRIAAGNSIHPSFAYAQLNVLSNVQTASQRPQLEATGNGVANEIADELATASMPLEYRPIGDARPRLKNALGQVTLRNIPAALLWVYVEDPEDEVVVVECVVVPPGTSFEEADVVRMTESATPGRWEGIYERFYGEGLYGVVYTALDRAGNVADPIVKTVVVTDATPPLDVTGLRVSASGPSSVTLTWLPSESGDTQGYRVYVTPPGGAETLWQDVGSVDTVTVDGLALTGTYALRVTAYDRVPLESLGVVVERELTGSCQVLPEVCDALDNNCDGIADEGGDALCDDGLLCNGTETCGGTSRCLPGASVVCGPSGGGVCRVPACDEATQGCLQVAEPDGDGCDDGDACTTQDQCLAGTCVGTARDCSGLDDDCGVGACDPSSGACVREDRPEGTGCDDGRACTTEDACRVGVCQGTALDCSAQTDACHVGSCSEAAGGCVRQALPDGSACDDGSYCTVQERCEAGVCGGGAARDCTAAADPCHAGLCDEGQQTCVAVPRPDGVSCNDGSFCTVDDACLGGACTGAARDCGALTDACNLGTCDEGANRCVAAALVDGTGCDDGVACTVSDLCQAGRCQGTARDCSLLTSACRVGQCSEAAGGCMAQARSDGSTCDDGLFCTTHERCLDGECGGVPRDCAAAGDACHEGVCDEGQQECVAAVKPDGAPCQDGLYCTLGDTCMAGACLAGAPRQCTAAEGSCRGGTCDEALGACTGAPIADGSWCDDGRYCQEPGACLAGTCVGAERDCSGLGDACLVGACDEALGRCVAEPVADGATCEDGLACTVGDRCVTGDCAGSPRDCAAAGDACTAGTCREVEGGCVGEPVSDGAGCDDGLFCVELERCFTGECTGRAVDCAAVADDCNEGACDEAQDACVGAPRPEGLACDDGWYCTVNDACVTGVCRGAARDCGLLSGSCTVGACDEARSLCVAAPAPDGLDCDDGLVCTEGDLCLDGACTGQTRVCPAATTACRAASCVEDVGGCVEDAALDGAWCKDEGTCVAGACSDLPCLSGAVRACGTSLGACSVGSQSCTAGRWEPCDGNAASPDLCGDGVDQDCDGIADNPDADADGALDCGEDCDDADPAAYPGAAEDCTDGRDGDCDGDPDATDPECGGCAEGQQRPCGADEGDCAAGVQTCELGAWGACDGDVLPEPERCDDRDNDCDGEVDEGCAAPGPAPRGGCSCDAVGWTALPLLLPWIVHRRRRRDTGGRRPRSLEDSRYRDGPQGEVGPAPSSALPR